MLVPWTTMGALSSRTKVLPTLIDPETAWLDPDCRHDCRARAVSKQGLSHRRSSLSLDGAADRKTSGRSVRLFRELGFLSRTNLAANAKPASLFLFHRRSCICRRLERNRAAFCFSVLGDNVGLGNVRRRAPVLPRAFPCHVAYTLHTGLSRFRHQRDVRCHVVRVLDLVDRTLACRTRAKPNAAIDRRRSFGCRGRAHEILWHRTRPFARRLHNRSQWEELAGASLSSHSNCRRRRF